MLSFNDFIRIASEDMEMFRYRFLADLQDAQRKFRLDLLFPEYAEILSFLRELEMLLQKKEELESQRNKIDVNLFSQIDPNYANEFATNASLSRLFKSAEWMIPRLKQVIEEGEIIADFFYKFIYCREVGSTQESVVSGYLIVENAISNTAEVMKYSRIVHPSKKGNTCELKTKNLFSAPMPESEQELFALRNLVKKKDGSTTSPATFFIESEIPFSYEEAFWPLARRKFLSHIMHL